MDSETTVPAFALLFAANAIPWIMGQLLGQRWSAPVDGGLRAWDGERLLGAHKTWRGLVSGTVMTGLAAQGFGLSFSLGAAFGAFSLLGDLISSFIKRRLRLAPGAELLGVDQLLEALLPLAVFAPALRLQTRDVLAVAIGFTMFDVLATRVRQRLSD